MLALEIEYLTGVSVAASVWDRARPEWPPHPDRVFSTLVSAWGERGRATDEREALEWLETLDPPAIIAPPCGLREVVDVFVPPNDMTVTGRLGSGSPKGVARTLAVIPALRRNRQPRQFPAVIPEAARTWMIWPGAAPPDIARYRDPLRRLVGSVAYLGHSASLVRLAVPDELPGHPPNYHPDPEGPERLRVPFPTRLAELVEGYDAATPELPFRPRQAPVVAYRHGNRGRSIAPVSVFGEDWIVLEDAGGTAPLLEATAIIAKRLRDALVDLADDPPPVCLSGHDPDGSPTREPHLAMLPLADVGWRYSEGRLLGVALVVPRGLEQTRGGERRAVLQAIARFTRGPDGEASLLLGALGVWRLTAVAQPERSSLRPARYLRASKRWATVTPVVLDRHPKPKAGADIPAVIAAACRNIGLPLPIAVEWHKHAAFRGAPAWTDFGLPKASPLASRPRFHLIVEFAEAVRGPVILGSGRFYGLGLCLPLADREGEP